MVDELDELVVANKAIDELNELVVANKAINELDELDVAEGHDELNEFLFDLKPQ